jgi:cytochrome c553
MLNMIGAVTLIAIGALMVWASVGVWRVQNKVLKWAGAGLLALLAAAVCLISILTVAELVQLHTRSVSAPTLKVVGTPEQIRRGQAIADSFCAACHSNAGPLTGGVDIGKEFPIPVGSFVSSNLTPAGELARWSDGEIFRAIRNGIDADGRWLIVMSYPNAGKLSDDDIEAVIAYIRRQPAAGPKSVNQPDHLNLLGVMMLGAGLLPGGKPVFTGIITAPQRIPPPNMANISCRIRIAASATVLT